MASLMYTNLECLANGGWDIELYYVPHHNHARGTSSFKAAKVDGTRLVTMGSLYAVSTGAERYRAARRPQLVP